MNQIKGLSRHQVAFGSLEDRFSAENPVRVIDAFVDKRDLIQFGIRSKEDKTRGKTYVSFTILFVWSIYFQPRSYWEK